MNSNKKEKKILGPEEQEVGFPFLEALFPRHILTPIYEKWKHEHPDNNRADDFYIHLLKQIKH